MATLFTLYIIIPEFAFVAITELYQQLRGVLCNQISLLEAADDKKRGIIIKKWLTQTLDEHFYVVNRIESQRK